MNSELPYRAPVSQYPVERLKNQLQDLQLNNRPSSMLSSVLRRIGFEEVEGSYEKSKQNRETAIRLISGFPIPENREEMLDFMILAENSIDPKHSKAWDRLFQAWIGKMESIRQAAVSAPGSEASLAEIEASYRCIMRFLRFKKKIRYVFPCLQVISGVAAVVSIYAMPGAFRFLEVFFYFMSLFTFKSFIYKGELSHV